MRTHGHIVACCGRVVATQPTVSRRIAGLPSAMSQAPQRNVAGAPLRPAWSYHGLASRVARHPNWPAPFFATIHLYVLQYSAHQHANLQYTSYCNTNLANLHSQSLSHNTIPSITIQLGSSPTQFCTNFFFFFSFFIFFSIISSY